MVAYFYGGILLPPICDFFFYRLCQHARDNYVNMQDKYVNMQLIYVNIQLIHVNMQLINVYIQGNYVNMQDNYVNMQLSISTCKIPILLYILSQ